MTLTLTSKTWARWARMERAPHRIPSDRALVWLTEKYGGSCDLQLWLWHVESAVIGPTLAARQRLKWPLKVALTRKAKPQKPTSKKLPPARRAVVEQPAKRPKITAEDTATAEREAALTRTVRQLQADVDRLTRENARLRLDLARQNSY